jgi:hypothetical protein
MHNTKPKAGFRGSETVAVSVVLYPHMDDPILSSDAMGPSIALNGVSNSDSEPSLISVETSKSLGAGSGTWNITIKEPTSLTSIAEIIADDDWIDITFNVNGHLTHVMRGLIDSITVDESTSNATSRTVHLSGRDHGAILENTPIWLNQFNAEFLQTELLSIFVNSITPTPDTAVGSLIRGFLKTQASRDYATEFSPPIGVPYRQDDILDNIRIVMDDFDEFPERITPRLQMLDPQDRKLWDFVAEYADPMFCELFTDLVPKDGRPYFDVGESAGLDETSLGIIFRTRPFPRRNSPIGDVWSQIPRVYLSPQDISSSSIGRSGQERFNVFYASAELINPEHAKLIPPIINTDDAKRHGIKEITTHSSYIPKDAKADKSGELLQSDYRDMMLDFHVLNPYLWNGTLSLGNLRPDIRIGSRLTIQGESERRNMNFYTEQVSHSWNLGQSKTTLGVTRGWRGTDATYLQARDLMISKFNKLKGS